jgi:hypothetical protein
MQKKPDGDNEKRDEMENTGGPGYMGWKIPEDVERSQEQSFQQRLEEMKMYYDKLKHDFVEL